MTKNGCYRDLLYWERALTQKDIWKGLFVPPEEMANPILVNSSLVDSHRGLIDNNWACYPDAASVLGFVQYIFMPTAFYFLSHPEERQIWIPIQPENDLLKELFLSRHPLCWQMAGFVKEAERMWELDQHSLCRTLPRFCARLSRTLSYDGVTLHVRPFRNTFEVSGFLQEIFWCEEVFREDIGVTPRQFDRFCRQFYQEPASKALFVRFLNYRVGCVV